MPRVQDSVFNGLSYNSLRLNQKTWYVSPPQESHGYVNMSDFNGSTLNPDDEDILEGQGCNCTFYGSTSATVPAGTTIGLVTSKLYQSGFPGVADINWNDGSGSLIPDKATMFQGCQPGNAVISANDHTFYDTGVYQGDFYVMNSLTGADVLVPFTIFIVLSSQSSGDYLGVDLSLSS